MKVFPGEGGENGGGGGLEGSAGDNGGLDYCHVGPSWESLAH